MPKNKKKVPGDELNSVIACAYPLEVREQIARRHGIDARAVPWDHMIIQAARHYLRRGHKPPRRNVADERRLWSLATAASLISKEFTAPSSQVWYGLDFYEAAQRLRSPLQRELGIEGIFQVDRDIREAARIMDRVFTRAAKTAAKSRAPLGRQPDEAMYAYVDYLYDLWRGHLGRRFSVDYHNGNGLGKTFEFISDCIAPLGRVRPQRIITAMRKVIAEHSVRSQKSKRKRR